MQTPTWRVARTNSNRLSIACALGGWFASLAGCERPQPPVAPLSEVTTAKVHAGETWNYRTRPGEETSFLTILKVESAPATGVIVHVRVDGVHVRNARAPAGFSDEIPHMPFSEAAIDGSVTTIRERGVKLPDFEEGYREWRNAFDHGSGGSFTTSVAEAVGFVESALAR